MTDEPDVPSAADLELEQTLQSIRSVGEDKEPGGAKAADTGTTERQ